MYYNENTLIFYNGSWMNPSEASCSLYSQSLHYGYAVFEGIRSYSVNGEAKIFKAKEHYERLRFSAETLKIPFRYTVEELTRLTYELLEKNNLKNAYIRPLVFSNHANMMLTPPQESTLLLAAWEWGKFLGDKPLRLATSPYQRPNPKAFHIEAKASGHYINSTLATAEAKARNFDEGLLLDADGYVAEGPGANFFFEKDKVLYTPPLGNILPGITRATVMELCQELGFKCVEKHFTPQEVKGSDSAFFTGTAAEVAPIKSLDGVEFRLNWENSLGFVLQKAYTEKVSGTVTTINLA